MKEKEDLKKEIEAVLFAAGRKVSIDEIARLCKAEKKETEDTIKELKQEYNQKDSPMFLTEEADGYKLTIREKYLSIVKEITPHTELDRSTMETLAVIAWKQPVLQAEVIKTRTSKAYEDIKNLVELGFISKDKHGRSYILKPTGKFFEYFELPSKEAVKEIFKDIKEIEPESQKKLEGMDVYETKKIEEEKEKPEEGKEPKEMLGKFEVYTEPEGAKEVEEEGAEETGETTAEKDEAEEIPEESEEAEEERAKKLIRKIAEEETEGENEEGKEEPDEETGEETEDEEEGEKQSKEEEEEKPKKKRLSKELEDWVGDEEPEKKKGKDE